ncbi:MAG TPA: hypothetical protein VK476_01870, partial [Flavobacterium sp.]|nr:hypothetical protein [Flavobacterium sp.]
MKPFPKSFFVCITLLVGLPLIAQHHSQLTVTADIKSHTLHVVQDLTFYNQSADSIGTIVLNDWNNAYSNKNSLLGKRFSDEFVRGFLLAKESEMGRTNVIMIADRQNTPLVWQRPEADLIAVALPKKLGAGEKMVLH